MKRFIPILSILLLLTSCSDFVEYTLDNEKIELLAPMEGLQSIDTSITFWWEGHEDAKFYRLQVVKPDFISTEKLIIDSIVQKTKLTIKLNEGKFQWRVRPENYGSIGIYNETRSLWITK